MDRSRCNARSYVPGDRAGHYESWFRRANHAQRPLAFWVRYTVFSPKGRPDLAVGELWAIHFDGERGASRRPSRGGASGTFRECSTARLTLGPLAVPPLTVAVLRLEGRELRLNALGHAFRAEASFDVTRWSFRTEAGDVRVSVRFEASPSSFVGLAYANPPGGTKTCLNSKLASCELLVEEPGRPERRLVSRQRAAFEILTDRKDHGIPVVA